MQSVVQGDYNDIEQLFFRGDFRDCFDPYYLALVPGPSFDRHDLIFHIADLTNVCGVDLVTSNAPIQSQFAFSPSNGWQHVAAVFEPNVAVSGSTDRTNQMRLYVNGSLIASNYTYLVPFRDLDPRFSPGISLGNRSRHEKNQAFRGGLDEWSVYARALTDPEITAIHAAARSGKANFRVLPAQSLAELTVSLDNVVTDTAFGDNAIWSTRGFVFTATRTNTVLDLQSLLPGTIVDGITLTELPAELNYLPEESLSILNGEDAYGVWKLEIWDTRAGGAATNDLAQLLQWQLNFVLIPSNPPPIITLQHGISYTNSLPAYGVQSFVVPVPQWALFATNVLEFAHVFGRTNPLAVNIYFDTNQIPVPGTNFLLLLSGSSGATNLTTNTLAAPWITSGLPYYLTLTNPNPIGVTFALGVWFDITTLTNCQAQTNFVFPAGIPRYFQLDVPTNGLPGFGPENVTFWLTGAQSNLTVVVSQHLPLPDLGHYDYISPQPCTNDEVVMVVTQPALTNDVGNVLLGPDTTPFPIQTNRWYVGVFNSAATNVQFTIQACYLTNFPTIIPLTNGVPYFADFVSHTNFLAPPGPPRWFFFQFQVTNWTDALLFELYNLSGDADLLLQRDLPPAMAPYFDGSFRTLRTPEQIVVRTGPDLANLQGQWYLGVYNNEITNLAYTIRAVRQANRMLLSGQPLLMTFSLMPSAPGYLLLGWNSIEGEGYIVQYTDDLRQPITWRPWPLPGGGVIATTPFSTIQVPIANVGQRFYRIAQVPLFSLGNRPRLSIRLAPPNQVRLSWSLLFPNETLQWAPTVLGPWNNLNRPVLTQPPDFAVFDNIGSVPRFYRLVP